MIVSSIAAMASNRVIGKNGDLPWKIPQDMKFFRDMTMGKIMLMGRKTFESFGKPLPGRLHVVVTRQQDYKPEGAHVFHDLDSALAFCRSLTEKESGKWGEEVFVVGGGEIYKETLPYTDRIYLTEIKAEFPGDTKFPEFDRHLFRETERRAGEGPVEFDFVTYERTRH
jgi:dihydrofolate reductase